MDNERFRAETALAHSIINRHTKQLIFLGKIFSRFPHTVI